MNWRRGRHAGPEREEGWRLGTRTTKLLAVVLLALAVCGVHRVGATSYDPLPRDPEPATQEIAPGASLYLFHSGTDEIRRSLKIGDVLDVLRIGPDGRTRTVGAVRATAFAGEFCLRAEVVSGKILPHDVALKKRLFLLVIPEALSPRSDLISPHHD